MAQQQRQFQVGGGNGAGGGGQTGDTTYTKIFVGGLAWETQRETMRRYFEQFGEIQEAVVIRDKNTGRSKGYGFVTFKDAESARRACQDPSPVIDGRRANCNLACLGAAAHVHRSRPPTPGQHGFGRFRPLSAAYHGPSTPATTAYFHQPTHYALPFSIYGYSGGYSQENMYPMSYYGVCGGGGGGGGGHHHQFSPYYAAAAAATAAELGVFPNFYPYYAQYAQGGGQGGHGGGFGLQYPQMLQYPYAPQSFGAGILSLPGSVAASTGVTPAPVGPGPSQPPGMAAEQKSLA